MKLKTFLSVTLAVLGVFSIAFAQVSPQQEELTLTTYYPAPYGNYTKLSVSGRTTSPALELNPALTATDHNDILTALHIRPAFNDGVFGGVRHDGLIVVDGNVGIGTTTPTGKLEVQGGALNAAGGLIIETRDSDDPASPAEGQIWLRTDISPEEQGRNYCIGGTPSFIKKSLPGVYSGFDPFDLYYSNWVGAKQNINDGRISTYIGFESKERCWSTPSPARGEFEGIVIFAETAPLIKKVWYVFEGVTGSRRRGFGTEVYLRQGGVWNRIGGIPYQIEQSAGFPPADEEDLWGPTTIERSSDEVTGFWPDVEGVKVEITADFLQVPAAHPLLAGCINIAGCPFTWLLDEVIAFGPPPPPVDIGLRFYNGSNTVFIGAEPKGTLTSPLRIAKGGDIYGIQLVKATAPPDPDDSGVRIRVPSGTWALRKY